MYRPYHWAIQPIIVEAVYITKTQKIFTLQQFQLYLLCYIPILYRLFCLSVRGSTSEKHLNHLQKLQKRAARIVTQNFNWDELSINIIRNLGCQTIRERYEFLTCCITYKAYFWSFSPVAEHHSVLTRGSTNNNLHLPKPNLTIFKSSLSYSGANLWNSLAMHIRDSPTYNTFKSRLKKLQKSKPPV